MKLSHFFLYLLPHLLGFLPIEADATRLFLNPHGLDQSRKGARHSAEYRDVALFSELDFLPILLHRFLIQGNCISIDVRMATDELFTK